jgi:hypothetical protein
MLILFFPLVRLRRGGCDIVLLTLFALGGFSWLRIIFRYVCMMHIHSMGGHNVSSVKPGVQIGFGRCYLLSSTSRSDPPFSLSYSGLVRELIGISPRSAGCPFRGRLFREFCPANGMSQVPFHVFKQYTLADDL